MIALFFIFELDRVIIRKIILSLMHKYVKIKWKAAGCMKKLYWLKGQRGPARQLLFLTGCTITQYLQVLYTKPS
jgi:hypothetical protein